MMDWKEFTKKFGTSTTNNFQLRHYAKSLGIKNFKCLMRDELMALDHRSNELPVLDKLPVSIIINLHESNQPGVHCSMIHAKDFSSACFFDSYGLPPTKEVKQFLTPFRNRYYSTFQLQKDNETFCGQMCLFVLYRLSKGKEFFNTVLDLTKCIEF